MGRGVIEREVGCNCRGVGGNWRGVACTREIHVEWKWRELGRCVRDSRHVQMYTILIKYIVITGSYAVVNFTADN